MSDGTCKDCRWWQPERTRHSALGYFIIHPEDPDTFEEMPNMPEMRYCDSPKLLFGERPVESDGATLMDGSNYTAALITGADFGCVNFEANHAVALSPD